MIMRMITTKKNFKDKKIPYKFRANIIKEFCDCPKDEDDDLIFEDVDPYKFLISKTCIVHGPDAKESPF